MSEPNQILYPRAALKNWLGGNSHRSYTPEEFRRLIEPTYHVYETYIHKCVAGLTTFAAQRAALHQEEDIPKLRKIILEMVPFWGLDGYCDMDKAGSQRLEQRYANAFDQAVSAARRSGAAPSRSDREKQEILIALEIHQQEMENDGELDAWVTECSLLKRKLQAEWEPSPPQQMQMEMGGM
ncbi:MAG: hypothetical protein K2L38_06285 [Dysosmobacter sp.]|nr:hypothetical protein [Dysosmobacter sp.]